MERKSALCLMVVLWLVGGAAVAHAAGKSSYVGGRFSLSVDGESAGFVKSFGGGDLKADVATHQLGTSHFQKKHLSTIGHSSLTMELDMSMGEPIWDWLEASFEQGHVTRDLVIAPDAFSATRLHQEFYDALITEVTFPAMDASDREPCAVTATAVFGHTDHFAGGGTPEGSRTASGKKWQCSNFRVEIGSLPTERVTRIEAITFTHEVADDSVGASRGRAEATVARVSNLTVTMSSLDLEPWLAWFNEFVIEGKCTDQDELTGSIELLDSDLGEAIANIDLRNVGIIRIDRNPMSVGDAMETFEVELYVEEIAFEHFGDR